MREKINGERAKIFVDSGGYQLARGTVPAETYTDKVALEWSEKNGGYFLDKIKPQDMTKYGFNLADLAPYIYPSDEEIKNVSNKPDIDFLKQKESEYKISIWKMSYGERLFLEFNKYHKFSSDEILSFFEQELKFFEFDNLPRIPFHCHNKFIQEYLSKRR